ncbi:MAG: SemiSWEET transporter [Chitinophagaceae bacterium]
MLLVIVDQVIGIVAGVLTGTSLLPQVIKIIKEKKAEDISIPMLLLLLSGLSLWVYYGVLKDDWPIIITNSFSVLCNILIIILKYRYK